MFTELDKLLVWRQARIAPGFDPSDIRQDDYYALIAWNQYGNRSSELGWEIDHKIPRSRGGSGSLSNLRALNWRNNLLRASIMRRPIY